MSLLMWDILIQMIVMMKLHFIWVTFNLYLPGLWTWAISITIILIKVSIYLIIINWKICLAKENQSSAPPPENHPPAPTQLDLSVILRGAEAIEMDSITPTPQAVKPLLPHKKSSPVSHHTRSRTKKKLTFLVCDITFMGTV